jgi:uncharacterized Fe-S radical SAM superfamily protein PflX
LLFSSATIGKKIRSNNLIYMPDFKYGNPVFAKKYSGAENYPDAARRLTSQEYAKALHIAGDAGLKRIDGVTT